jgi:hypothetical protein
MTNYYTNVAWCWCIDSYYLYAYMLRYIVPTILSYLVAREYWLCN